MYFEKGLRMCGIFGTVNQERQASNDTYWGLLALQHRGKQGAGIAVVDETGHVRVESGRGELPQAFWQRPSDHDVNPPEIIGALRGYVSVGHVRYATSGGMDEMNLQPIRGMFHGREFAIAHNGNLVNLSTLRGQIANYSEGCSDSQVIANLISLSPHRDFGEALVQTAKQLEGAFSIVAVFDDALYAIRDKFGFHPLQVGWRNGDWIVASESCALDTLEAQLVRDVYPGELFTARRKGQKYWYQWAIDATLKFDIFEYIYFLRPDSIVNGVEVGDARYRMGKYLAQEHPINDDLSVSVPDSGNEAARGYWQGMQDLGHRNLEFHPWAVFRPHIASRTFLEPVQAKRKEYLNLKFSARPTQLGGRRVVETDDSLVRGNTATTTAQYIRRAGAKSVVMVLASPPYLYPDFYGIDTYRIKNELEAQVCKGNIQSIADKHGLDHLAYLSLDRTIQAVLDAQLKSYGTVKDVPSFARLSPQSFYTGPFTGEYPAGTGDFKI